MLDAIYYQNSQDPSIGTDYEARNSNKSNFSQHILCVVSFIKCVHLDTQEKHDNTNTNAWRE